MRKCLLLHPLDLHRSAPDGRSQLITPNAVTCPLCNPNPLCVHP